MSGTQTMSLKPILGMLLCVLSSGLHAAETLRLSVAQVEAAGIRLVQATAVTVATTHTGAERGIRLAGKVVAPGEAGGVILSTVSGQLDSVLVQIGARVRAGQPLARIASSELAALQNEYLKARAAAELADKRLTRDEALYADGIISEARLLETRAARQLAVATERERRGHLSLAGFAESTILAIAPASISGVVTIQASADALVLSQSAAIGQHVEPGTELFRLSGSKGAWLELHAPVRNAQAIQVGDIVSVAGCASPGRIIGVGSQLDAESQTFLVRAEMSDATCVRPNQYTEADVLPGSVPPGLVSVPASALVRNADRDYVFVENGGAFTPVPVTVERRRGDVTWLRGGITAGNRVAAAGLTALKGAWLGFGPAVEASGAQ